MWLNRNDSLVMLFNFENSSELSEDDTTIVDVSQQSNNGVPTNTLLNTTACYSGNCRTLAGSDYINVSDHSSLDFGTGPFTVSIWFRVPSTVSTTQELIGKRAGGSGNYEIQFDASRWTSGVYYYQLRAGDYLDTKKMILLK